jgi:hypothetical protein
MQAGASEAKIAQVADAAASGLFGESEKAAIEYAEAMTVTDRRVSDQLFARVRSHFSEAQVVELTSAVALENFRSKFNVALGIEAQGFCTLRLVSSRSRRRRRAPARALVAPGLRMVAASSARRS